MPSISSFDLNPSRAVHRRERDHADNVLEHAPERRRFNHRRRPAILIHLRESRCAIVIASTSSSKHLKNPSRKHQEHGEHILFFTGANLGSPPPSSSITAASLIVPFEPSSFTRGGAPSPSRSTSHRCRQDLDNPSSTHDNCIIGEEVD
nr:uncharacterized protein LOC107280405 isoform X1 [Oryza sativa Japonica Group]XP_025880226.1 uncharacterized protein LOC107280406 isoform X1 [Oryza sativa Japonica Group]